MVPQIYATSIPLASPSPIHPELADTLDNDCDFIEFSFNEGWDEDLQIVQDAYLFDEYISEDEVPKITPKQSLSLHACGQLGTLLSSSQMSSFDPINSEFAHTLDLEMPTALTP